MLAAEIIKKPIITEKSMLLVEENKYTFEVDSRANKIQIAKAIEELFDNVKVQSVNKIKSLPKRKRVGQYTGFKPAVTKAIITLTKDSKKIEIFNA